MFFRFLVRSSKLVFFPVILLFSAGCSNVSYYNQSVWGHLDIMWKRVPIDEILADEHTTVELKQKLQLVLDVRAFASESLELPDNNSYRTYVDLQRPYVVWNTIAAPEFSLDLRQWCFWFVGCVRYKGYYAQEDAEVFADTLRTAGDDVIVLGTAAYSTLGWFDDPMLNTIIRRKEASLAGLIFHELAHQQLYVKNDTAFNESFAKAVELEGVQRWLAFRGSPELNQDYVMKKHRHDQFLQLIKATTEKLMSLYQSNIEEQAMRDNKAAIFDQMRMDYERLKMQWGGYKGYDKWFSTELNNAKLGAVAIYRDYVPAFQQLLKENNGQLVDFYEAAAQLGNLAPEQRKQKINDLLAQAAQPGGLRH